MTREPSKTNHPVAPDGDAARRATMRDVADQAGVSMQTVSNFLNQRHTPRRTTRDRIERAIRELNYRPNASARSLRSQRTGSIVLVMEDLNQDGTHDPLHLEFLRGAATAARAAGFTLMVELTSTDQASDAALGLVREHRVDGVVLSIGDLTNLDRTNIEKIIATQTPVVLLQHHTNLRGVHTVSARDADGAASAVDHLVTLGHKKIAFVSAQPVWPSPRQRRDGAHQACTKAGVEFEIWPADAYTVDAARRAVADRLLAYDAPTAVIAVNNIIALGVIQQAADLGLDVPGNLSVVGFSAFDFASWVRPAITTVRLPGAQIAARAIDLAATPIDNAGTGEDVTFQVELVPRETTAPPSR